MSIKWHANWEEKIKLLLINYVYQFANSHWEWDLDQNEASSVIWYPHLPPPSSFFSTVFYNEPGLRPKGIFLHLSQLFLVFKGWSFCALRKAKKASCFNQDNKGFFVLKQDAVDPAVDCQAVCTWKLSNLPLLWFVYERIRLNLINPRVLKIERGLHVKMLDSAPFTVQPWKNATCLRGHFAQKDLRNHLLSENLQLNYASFNITLNCLMHEFDYCQSLDSKPNHSLFSKGKILII